MSAKGAIGVSLRRGVEPRESGYVRELTVCINEPTVTHRRTQNLSFFFGAGPNQNFGRSGSSGSGSATDSGSSSSGSATAVTDSGSSGRVWRAQNAEGVRRLCERRRLKLDVFLAQVEENLGDYIHRWTRLTKAEALSA